MRGNGKALTHPKSRRQLVMLGTLPPFDYYRPSTIQEILGLLSRMDGGLSLFAGGTDLLVAMKERRLTPRALVDVKHIPALSAIHVDDGGLRLGAAVSTRQISRSPIVRQRFPLIAAALKILGSMQVGNRATLGGNLCNASPAADSAPPLLALQASVGLVGPSGERRVALEEFFLGPGRTVLDHELLVEVQVPEAPSRGRGIFYKLGPRGAPEDICIASVAVFAAADENSERWRDVRIALGAVAPTPIRARHAEASLQGQPLCSTSAKEAGRLAAEKDAQPITDIRGSSGYRRALVRVLVERALGQLECEVVEGNR